MAMIKNRRQPPSKSTIKSREYISDSASEDDGEMNMEGESKDSRENESERQVRIRRGIAQSRKSMARSSSSSDSMGEEEDSMQSSTPDNTTGVPATLSPVQSNPEPQAATAFEPPHGFQATSLAPNVFPSSSKLFSAKDQAGKQLWYITAPASVPIHSLKEVALESVRKGKIALEYNRVDYGFLTNAFQENMRPKLLIPDPDTDGYSQARLNIVQSLHLQQIIHLPNPSIQLSQSPGRSRSGNHSSPTPARPPRKQPKGLKMRFLPTGFGIGRAGKIGSSSSGTDGSEEDDKASSISLISDQDSSVVLSKKRKSTVSKSVNGDRNAPSEELHKTNGSPRKKVKHAHRKAESSNYQQPLGKPPRGSQSNTMTSHDEPKRTAKTNDNNSAPSSSVGGGAAERKKLSKQLLDNDGSRSKKDKYKQRSSRSD